MYTLLTFCRASESNLIGSNNYMSEQLKLGNASIELAGIPDVIVFEGYNTSKLEPLAFANYGMSICVGM